MDERREDLNERLVKNEGIRVLFQDYEAVLENVSKKTFSIKRTRKKIGKGNLKGITRILKRHN